MSLVKILIDPTINQSLKTSDGNSNKSTSDLLEGESDAPKDMPYMAHPSISHSSPLRRSPIMLPCSVYKACISPLSLYSTGEHPVDP